VDTAVVRVAQEGVRRYYRSAGAEVSVLPAAEMPRSTFYPPRRRYQAERLLDSLAAGEDGRFDKVMGLTEYDISTTKGDCYDWGVFGLGSLGGRACVVSTFRLGRHAVDRELFYERLGKVLNHELGHTFGLDHCPTRTCLMEDAKGTIATVDSETGVLCSDCAARLDSLLR
jgi:archaemetzincin